MRLVSQKRKCKFFLATVKNTEEQKILHEILDTEYKDKCRCIDDLSLHEILPVIKIVIFQFVTTLALVIFLQD